MLGIRPDYDALQIDPCIPARWPGFEVVRKWRGATFRISVKNPSGVEKGVKTVSLDGRSASLPIPAQEAGSTHEVIVTMG